LNKDLAVIILLVLCNHFSRVWLAYIFVQIPWGATKHTEGFGCYPKAVLKKVNIETTHQRLLKQYVKTMDCIAFVFFDGDRAVLGTGLGQTSDKFIVSHSKLLKMFYASLSHKRLAKNVE